MKVVSEMLAQALPETPGQTLVTGGEAELARTLSDGQSTGQTVWVATDLREIERVGDVAGFEVRADPAHPLHAEERFDAVALPVPPDRVLARRWLAMAAEVMPTGGNLVVAGANAEGIRSIIADAGKLFGAPRSEEYRQKHRVARFERGALPEALPDWLALPGIAPGTWQHVDVRLADGMLSLATLPGVFAGNRMDAGTALLLDHLDVVAGSRVLDAGCGAGAIGLTAARQGAGHVDMSDVDLLAVASVRETLARQEIANARVFASDVYGSVSAERYDLIVSNPPFHQGKAIDYAMPDRLISEASAHLNPGGRVLIVANAFLAYGTRMERCFREVRTVASTRQYHVFEASSPR